MNGRRAGSRFERECVELLRAWWDPHEPGKWARTPLSGGWSTKEHRGAFRTAGDVVTTCRSFPFSVECKRRRAIYLDAIVGGTSAEFRKAWAQAERQADEAKLKPLLLFRRPRLPVFAAVYAGTCPLNPGDWLRVCTMLPPCLPGMGETEVSLAVAPLDALLALEPAEVVRHLRLVA